MTPVLVLCPTFGRPEWAREMLDSFRDTATEPSTRLVLVLERDDPEFGAYIAVMTRHRQRAGWVAVDGGTLVRASNIAAALFWDRDIILGHVGDDHRFETTGWDRTIAETLEAPGVAYGNDGHWGQLVATAPFVSAVIPRSLGWLALPTCQHNGWDNAVMDIGRGIGALHYLPEVRIAHPDADERRASTDPGYRRARSFQDADKAALREWRENGLAGDLARLRGALGREVAA